MSTDYPDYENLPYSGEVGCTINNCGIPATHVYIYGYLCDNHYLCCLPAGIEEFKMQKLPERVQEPPIDWQARATAAEAKVKELERAIESWKREEETWKEQEKVLKQKIDVLYLKLGTRKNMRNERKSKNLSS
jgi:hypothetical protein